jgi:hypothetical protein
MGFIENMYIESVLKEQRDIFNELHKDEIEQFRQQKHSPQETETKFHEWEISFRKWFIDNFIIPKYFP